MCAVLDVSPSGYYASRKRSPSARAIADERLLLNIRIAHAKSDGSYGAPRVQRELQDDGVSVGTKRVARLMRQDGLQGRAPRGWRPATTDSAHAHPIAPNLLARQFDVHGVALNQVWVSDITYVPTRAGWVYLATVLDLASRRVVGWAMRDTLDAELAIGALHMALSARRPAPGLIHHSDRGSQGGCNRSSQHLTRRGCDVRSEKVGTLDARRAALTGTTARRTARRSAAVLGGDCARVLRRSGGGRGARVVGRRGTVVSTGRGYAANAPCSVRAPAVRALPVLCRA
jgi:transposase InsO family protein